MNVILLIDTNNALTPITNPIGIFLILAFIILAVPLLNKIKIPHIIGLILAGIIVGPHTLNIIASNAPIEILSSVGILYIMFQAGLEIDLHTFSKYSKHGILFGIFTFIIPIILGLIACRYLIKVSWITAWLISSIFACHTLVAYPLVSKMGIQNNRAVSIAIVATIVAVVVSLIALTAIINVATGLNSALSWLWLLVRAIIFAIIMFVLLPRVASFFLKTVHDSTGQYIFVLVTIFASSLLAKAAGLEGILGAFLAGLVLNRLIPNVSPLMNRIEFVGNSLFIPFFLISIGMTIDPASFMNAATLIIALTMSATAISSKWIAAWGAQKSLRLSNCERELMFGLTSGKAAATLAAGMVAYQVGIIDDTILNGSVIMILITCTISSISTERSARKIAFATKEKPVNEIIPNEQILIPISNPQTMPMLIELGNVLKKPQNTRALTALKITTKEPTQADIQLLDTAAKLASATDNIIATTIKTDFNITNCITTTAEECRATDIIVGLHHKSNIVDSILGSIISNLISDTSMRTLYIYRPLSSISNVRNIKLIVPQRAEAEAGFAIWVERIKNAAIALAVSIEIYATQPTQKAIHQKLSQYTSLKITFNDYTPNELPTIAENTNNTDLVIIIAARRQTISYSANMQRTAGLTSKHFSNNSLILIYPQQHTTDDTIFNPLKLN